MKPIIKFITTNEKLIFINNRNCYCKKSKKKFISKSSIFEHKQHEFMKFRMQKSFFQWLARNGLNAECKKVLFYGNVLPQNETLLLIL